MENFIKLEKTLLQREDITPTDKLIISYLQSYQNSGNYYFAGGNQLAEELGLTILTIKRRLKILEEKKIIFKSQDKKYIQHTFQNRKALVVVDKDNQYPTNEVSKKTSNEVKEEKNNNIPKEVVKPLKSNNNNKEEKQVEMKKEDLDKLLTSRQNGEFSLSSVEDTKVEGDTSTKQNYQTAIKNNWGEMMKIDDDLVEYFNEKIKHKEGYVRKNIKNKSEFIMNMNLRDKMESELTQ